MPAKSRITRAVLVLDVVLSKFAEDNSTKEYWIYLVPSSTSNCAMLKVSPPIAADASKTFISTANLRATGSRAYQFTHVSSLQSIYNVWI